MSTETTTDVRTEARGAALLVEIDRASKMNAINHEVLDGILESLERAAADPGIRTVIITGAGKAFAAGADISLYADADNAQFGEFTRKANLVVGAIASHPKPVIAAVNGIALGGGCEIALASDLVIAAPRASFGLPEVQLGLIPGWGGTQRLTDLIGPKRAMKMIMLSERLSAQEAHEAGIVAQIADDVLQAALDLAEKLAERAPHALAAVKRTVQARAEADPDWNGNLGRGYRNEQEELGRLFDSPDGHEGIHAFVEKRPAHFGSAQTH